MGSRINCATSRAPRLGLGIRDNTVIRSDMKSSPNSRHNIEKYGFICYRIREIHIPVSSRHPTQLWLQNARGLLTRKKQGDTGEMFLAFLAFITQN